MNLKAVRMRKLYRSRLGVIVKWRQKRRKRNLTLNKIKMNEESVLRHAITILL